MSARMKRKPVECKIFSDITEFWDYLESGKSCNGFDEEFIKDHPNYIEDNKTNINCWNCETSTDCVSCSDLTNCTFCHDCHNCQSCTDCKECTDCSNCHDCNDMEDCQNCDNCKTCGSIKKCTNCTECNGIENSHFRLKNKPMQVLPTKQ